MGKKKLKFIDIMRKEAKKNPPITSFNLLELIMLIGFSFFLILMGTWALPQMPKHVQVYFALSILCAAVYVIYHQFNHWGFFDD